MSSRSAGEASRAIERWRELALVRVTQLGVWREMSQLRARFGLLRLSFLLCVVLPTAASGLYVVLFAPREYVAEARVVVRSGNPAAARLAANLSSLSAAAASLIGGASESTQNAFLVSDYISSRNIIADLGGKTRLQAIYSAENGSWLGSLSSGATMEEVWKFWQKKVRSEIDVGSGILTVQIRAYRPIDAYRLANDTISLSEALVNRVSERSRADAEARAAAEVNRARKQVIDADQALLLFRNRAGVIDPADEAQSTAKLIADLLKERMTLENQRAAMGQGVTSASPVAKLIQSRMAEIDHQIEELKQKLTTSGANPAVSSQLAIYENLQLRSKFAEQFYTLAQAGYEAARETKERQQLYLMTIVRPSMPEEALYPRRLADTFLAFGLSLILWSLGALIVAAVLDHRT